MSYPIGLKPVFCLKFGEFLPHEMEKIIEWKISSKPCEIRLNVKLRKLSKLGGKIAWISGCSKHFMEGGKTILGDARKFGGGGNFFGMGDKKIHL